jgi:hypothetical protein
VPVAVITEPDAEHPPATIAFGGVVDNVWRPSQTKAGVSGFAEQKEVRFVPRFPGKMALGPAHNPSTDATILALIYTALAGSVYRLRRSRARPRHSQHQKHQNWNDHPERPSPHIRNQFYTKRIIFFSDEMENTQFYWCAFYSMGAIQATKFVNLAGPALSSRAKAGYRRGQSASRSHPL